MGPAGYCCLGVLQEIAGIKQTNSGNQFLDIEHSGLRGEIQTDLAHMNDRGDSFDAIADYIEKEIT